MVTPQEKPLNGAGLEIVFNIFKEYVIQQIQSELGNISTIIDDINGEVV